MAADNKHLALPGFSSPTASTEAPLEMLAACHARIDSACATLRRLPAHLATHGADEAARSAAAGVMRYFDTAAIDHHADEETDLFPALLESMAGSDAVCLRELTESLCAEHRQLEAAWRRVRGQLWRVGEGDAAALSIDAVEQLVSAYARHIEREEQELLPLAARLLSDEELAVIGRAMRLRRGMGAID